MKKALMIAPAASVFRSFCSKNIEALKNLGYEIYLAANFSDNDAKKQSQYIEYAEECKRNGIKIIDIDFKRKSFFKNIRCIKALKKLIKDEDFDLIHSHTETGGLICGFAFSGNNRTKKIYTPHGISFYKGSSFFSWLLFYPVERWICSHFDRVLAINKEEYAILKKWKKDNAVFVHGIGVDTGRFGNIKIDREKKRAEFKSSDDDFVILCVGELNQNKNHRVVIEALSKIKNPYVKCVICGIGGLKENLETMIEEKGLLGSVFLPGYRTDIEELMACADLFVFPSFHEGLPVSVMEAMSAGLPVVCSKIRGNVDLIDNNEGGFLCDPRDAEQFKTAIEILLNDADLRAKMSEINKIKVKDYDMCAVETELENVYGGDF